ncbi:hypothetical protein B484DRAFT_77204 [Ochromonadaceae sp. CCMP2298]|nr:hypothetical protein B484DRAFT_77204 [Ochromonadaceae sp. CCMP2298]
MLYMTTTPTPPRYNPHNNFSFIVSDSINFTSFIIYVSVSCAIYASRWFLHYIIASI